MAKYDVTAPDGTAFEVDAPDGASEAAVMSYAKQQFSNMRSGKRDIAKAIDSDAISTGARAAMKPTMGEDLAKQFLLTGRYGLEGLGGGVIADKMGLPSPSNSTERVVGDVARTMAGTAALTSAAAGVAPMLTGIPRSIAELFASSPLAQVTSAAGAGAGGGMARESGAGPMGQLAGSLVGGMAVPVAGMVARGVGNKLGDIAATVGAGFGNEAGINRIAKDAAVRVAGDSRQQQIDALQRAKTFVPGAEPTAGEAIAGQQIGAPGQFGGGTVRLQKDLSGAVGLEDILPSKAREQKTAISDYLEGLRLQTAPMRTSALDKANTSGISAGVAGMPVDSVVTKLDTILADPSKGSPKLVQKTLESIKDDIAGITDANGYVDAKRLYTIRKEIGNTIDRFAKETSSWDKRLSAGLERDVQGAIDEAIIAGGGTNWKDYLNTFSSGMRNVENTLARQKEMKLIAAGTKSQNPTNLAAGEVPKLPNLLSRPAMITNFGLKLIARDAATPVMRRLAEQMTDPQKYAELLKLPPSSSVGQMARDIARQAAAASIAYQQNSEK